MIAHPSILVVLGNVLAMMTEGAISRAVDAPAAPTTRSTGVDDQATGPVIVEGSLQAEIGTIPAGGIISHTFALINTSATAKRLRVGPRSCACVNVSMEGGSELPAHGTAKVTVDFLAKAGGAADEAALIYVEGSPVPLALRVRAIVVDDVRVSPGAIEFGDVSPGSPVAMRPLRVSYVGHVNSSFRVLSVTAKDRRLKILSATQPVIKLKDHGLQESTWCYEIAFDVDSAISPKDHLFADLLAISATLDGKPMSFSVPASAAVTAPVTAAPSKIVCLVAKTPAVFDEEITLRAVRGVVEIEDCTAEGVGFHVSRDVKFPQRVSLRVSINSEVTKRLEGVVHVRVKAPVVVTVDIPVIVVLPTNP